MGNKIGVIGIGNSTSVLVQRIEYYRGSNKEGLLRPTLASYYISDINQFFINIDSI